MAKVVASSGMTVEFSGREVELIRQALQYSVRNNAGWDNPEDADANEIIRVLARGGE
ncbi:MULTISPECIES: hypothetical protein [unclassified Streptomyces]|uniref:hypothetical protein n=1 Tax=unclassified Streptomyces TaxID=2593676 RepID=UPI0036ECA45E